MATTGTPLPPSCGCGSPYLPGAPVRLWNLLRADGRPERCHVPTAEALLASASASTGLTDFGQPTFTRPLCEFLAAVHETGQLTPFGRFYTEQLLLGLLRNRLFIERASRLGSPVSDPGDPLVIMGTPRSGTTFLHELLSRDRRNRCLATWEALQPAPCPSGWRRHPWTRRIRGRVAAAGIQCLAPSLRRIHRVRASAPDECGRLMMHQFTAHSLATSYDVPGYLGWLLRQDLRDAMRYHHRVLQLLGVGSHGERWVLKNPLYTTAIDALLEQYPGARFIQCHRDPLQAIPSQCSLMMAIRSITSSRPDAGAIGSQATRIVTRGLEEAAAVRERHHPARFLDIHYPQLISDPLATVDRVYSHFNLPLASGARKAMRQFAAHSRRRRREHMYSLAEYGLDPYTLHKSLRHYCSRFRVAPEHPLA